MARLRRVHVLGLSLSLLALSAPPALAAAESLPASVRACASETDSLRRLVCYDREVARYPEPKAGAPAAPSMQTAPSARPPQAASPALSPTPASQTASPAPGPPPVQAASPAPSVPAAPTAQAASVPSATSGTTKSAAAAPSPGHIAAQVIGIDPSPGEMVLHLDNGQVWQQTQAASGDLSLQVGDTVSIDKHFGSFWLTGPHVSGMKVRQKS